MSIINPNGPGRIPLMQTTPGGVGPTNSPIPVTGPQDVFVPGSVDGGEFMPTRQAMMEQLMQPQPQPQPQLDFEKFLKHMTDGGKIQGKEIVKSHREEDFFKHLKAKNGVTVTTPTGLPEVNIQEYRLQKFDGQGNPLKIEGPNGKKVPSFHDSPNPKTTFGPSWTPERLKDVYETVFGDIPHSNLTGQTSTIQVKVGDDYFVAKVNPDGTPEKFYVNRTPDGSFHTKEPSVLDRFRQTGKAPATEAPKAPETEAPKAPAAEAPKAPAAEAPKAPVTEAAKAGGPAPETTLGKVTRVGGGVLSVGLGAVQTASGIQDLKDGKVLDGVTDTAGGALNVAGGVGLVAGSTVAAPVALAAAAGLDAGRDIVKGIQTGDKEKLAVGGVKGVGAAMMGAAPFVAGSVVGAPVGLVLGLAGGALYAGASLYDNREAVGQAVAKGAQAVADTAAKAGTAVADTAAKAGAAVADAASQAGSAISEAASGLKKWATSWW